MSALALEKFTNAKTSKYPVMETVVLNSIIYSEPSFCTIVIDMSDDTTTVFRKEKFPRFQSSFPNSTSLKNFHWTNLIAPSPSAETRVYRICTTLNGSINHQITDVSGRHLAELFCVTNSANEDNNFIQYGYNVDEYFCLDDFVETEISPMDIDDDIECPIESLPKLSCDKKKKVHFDSKPTVHILRTWNYAYRLARKSDWRILLRKHKYFKRRIKKAASYLKPILKKKYREKIYKERFANFNDNDKDEVDIFEQPAIKKLKPEEISTEKAPKKKQRIIKVACNFERKHIIY